MKQLKNKVALITGASRGIGKAIALRFARLGADIVVNYHSDKAAAKDVVNQIEAYGVKALAVKADISKTNEIDEIFASALNVFGRLDIVVVNAGLELVGVPVTGYSEDQFDRLFNTNTKGAFFTMRAAARQIADNGRIIYIGSSTTGLPNPGYALHGGSKIAPLYLVRVEADAPIRQMIPNFYPMGRMGTPEDIANVAEFFAGDLASFVIGQQLLVSGGASAYL